MTTKDEALRVAVEALEKCRVIAVPSGRDVSPKFVTQALSLLRSALEEGGEPKHENGSAILPANWVGPTPLKIVPACPIAAPAGRATPGGGLSTAGAPGAQPPLEGVEPVSDADNLWFGDMMILQVLADSDNVNEQEREVLTRWMAASDRPTNRAVGVLASDGSKR